MIIWFRFAKVALFKIIVAGKAMFFANYFHFPNISPGFFLPLKHHQRLPEASRNNQ